MHTLTDQISKIDFTPKQQALKDALEATRNLISGNLPDKEKILLRHDFDIYLKTGRILVHNTFAGGIIFLREPEIITVIKIEFNSVLNEVLVSVEYSSEKRNPRNVKYKPEAGKIESTTWSLLGIFPNFNKYNNHIQIALMSVIGRSIKRICEHYRKISWFMKFEKEFELKIFMDDKIELNYIIEID